MTNERANNLLCFRKIALNKSIFWIIWRRIKKKYLYLQKIYEADDVVST